MTREIINFVPPQPQDAAVEFEAPNDPAHYMPQLRRRYQSTPRWLALAVLTGAIVALAFVRFLAR